MSDCPCYTFAPACSMRMALPLTMLRLRSGVGMRSGASWSRSTSSGARSSYNTPGSARSKGRHENFWQVTGDALDFAMETLGITDGALRERLMNLYLSLESFPEVPDVLRRLKATGIKTAILSNGTPEMLRAPVDNSKIGDSLDEVLSVEDVGVYKPHPRVYQLAVDRIGIEPRAISF
jgi:2-haloalkanoic acid dehalogenase type II